MKGADEYATLFSSGQHGRLYLDSSSHARGKTFRIWVLPSEEPIQTPPWNITNAVEVYGITGGNPGWTETYGWLHHGPWEQDFAEMVKTRREEIAATNERKKKEEQEKDQAEKQRIKKLLAAY